MTNKESQQKKYAALSVVIGVVLVSTIVVFFVGLPRNKQKQAQLTGLQVCTDGISQDECYQGDYPDPRLNWSCCEESAKGLQAGFRVQVDEQRDFSSPEIDSGNIISSSTEYQVGQAGLQPGTIYYWRLRIQDPHGTWSDWAVHETPLLTTSACE